MKNPDKPDFVGRSDDKDYLFDQRIMAMLVAISAFALPVVLIFYALSEGHLRDSISHYYYSPFFGEFFVGALCFIGAMLIAFRGRNPRETRWSTLAGIAALIVPLFPTTGPGYDLHQGPLSVRAFVDASLSGDGNTYVLANAMCKEGCFSLFPPISQTLHFGAAVFLFVVLAYMSLFVFTEIQDTKDMDDNGQMKAAKIMRNRWYRGCGVVIALVLVIDAIFFLLPSTRGWWDTSRLTFWSEAVMVFAFAISWAIKGRCWSIFPSIQD